MTVLYRYIYAPIQVIISLELVTFPIRICIPIFPRSTATFIALKWLLTFVHSKVVLLLWFILVANVNFDIFWLSLLIGFSSLLR